MIKILFYKDKFGESVKDGLGKCEIRGREFVKKLL